VAKSLFWISFAVIFYTYAGYPLLMTFLAKFKKTKALPKLSIYPTVSILIAAYNEVDFIQKKIENLLTVDYPRERLEILIASDGSTDGTNDIIKQYSDKGIKCYFNGVRRGKPYVLNRLVEASKGEICLFTDARQLMEKSALLKLMRGFQDSTVGCVSGELLYRPGSGVVRKGIGLYWEYEKYLREMESNVTVCKLMIFDNCL